MGATGSESDGCDSYLFSKEIQYKSIFRKSISNDRCAGECLSDLHYSAGKKICKIFVQTIRRTDRRNPVYG